MFRPVTSEPMTSAWEPTELLPRLPIPGDLKCARCQHSVDTYSFSPRTSNGEFFCENCHSKAHPIYLKGCDYCEARSKTTQDTKQMAPLARVVENTKRVAILVGILGILAGAGLIGILASSAEDQNIEDASYEYSCAAVRDFANGDDMSEILGDLQARISDASGRGDPTGHYQGAHDVIAFGSESEVGNWLAACNEG